MINKDGTKMDQSNRISFQYKMVLPWALPLLGLLYGYFTLPPGVASNVFLVTALLCVAGAALSGFLGLRIITSLGHAVKSATASANGDFSYDPPLTGHDELTHLLYTMGNLRTSLRDEAKNDDASTNINNAGKVAAINKTQAMIEFDMNGIILNANDNFLGAMGYRLDEIKGQHHSIFVEPAFKNSNEYKQFWEKLNRGEFESKEYKRIGNGGKEVWIQASYNPIIDENGKVIKVVKFATDITQTKISAAENAGQLSAINKAQAVIEFNMDGTIITANDNFLATLGYSLAEIKGNHHKMFVEPGFQASAEYTQFWEKLNRGEYETAEYKRIGKGGKEVWIQASYNPILDLNGKPFKVVKFATDVTQQKINAAGNAGQLSAINKAQAVIEFNMDGTIITANDNFLATLGYSLAEIKGNHHKMFVEPDYQASAEYTQFWEKLNRGEYETAEYKRIGKGGKEVWIQASYNPILDLNGKPFKVVKFATDVTQQKINAAENAGQLSAINKAQAVIEFNMDGTIITANDNFLATLGYSLAEIKGNHHKMFVEPGYQASVEYAQFWEKLNRGEYESAEYKRIGKGGKEVWIQASYNPILDLNGKPFKVVKFATDVTQQKMDSAENAGQLSAISKAQAVIEFNMDGTIITANDNFLMTLGYTLAEVKGQHHSIFVEPAFKASTEYQQFWDKLNRGEYETAEYKRIGKGGKEVWIQASYNPILDLNGKPFKVVKFATDITQRKSENIHNNRVRMALDACAESCLVVADENYDVVYTNKGVNTMFEVAETDIKKTIPSFLASKVLGSNIEIFHENPSYQRDMLNNLTSTHTTKLKLGDRTFAIVLNPIISVKGQRIGTVMEWEDQTEILAQKIIDKRIADENTRVKLALDACGANTMIANSDFDIIYMNKAVEDMMSNAEADIRTELPSFFASKVMGSNIDIFHKNPAHQRNMVGNLTSTYSTEILVGGRTFGIVVNPINNEQGERLGTVVEWNDRTEEVAVEKEVDKIIESAGAGDLTVRATIENKKGFFKILSVGLNRLVGISENVINDTARILDAMSSGKLSERIDADYEGIFNKLKTDANTTGEKLTEIIGNISEAAGAVATGSNEIAQGNTDLSQRTEEQASSLEEIAASMEEMTSSVKQTAENANHANELAGNAQDKARKGGEVVGKAVVAMDEINSSSKKIADIIGVIDEIAFQTNLLALNAAVEAARAGEQGKGFAVVAGEVRNLAQRSAGAAKEIKDLIRDSVEKVDNGTELVNESGTTLSEIVDAVEKVSKMIKEISLAAEEQSSGINQVNTAIGQMDEMTQQNAALVEEASAASETMTEQAKAMQDLVGFFKMGRAAGGSNMRTVNSAPRFGKSRPSVSGDSNDWQEF
jgi:methyl-accepting chemotaxis protein